MKHGFQYLDNQINYMRLLVIHISFDKKTQSLI